MTVLAVDLAAKYSAFLKMSDNFLVIREAHSWMQSEEAFLFAATSDWAVTENNDLPDVLVVEDLPHGLSYSTLVKRVCRLQGRLIQSMHDRYTGRVEDVLFVAPRAWRAHFDLKRGTGPEAVFDESAKYGYAPPTDLEQLAKGNGGRTRARKVASDYCSAYLIARWAIDMKRKHGTYDVPGTSRYGTNEILSKDFHDQDL